MSYVLKARTVDGRLAPARGEHVEYSDVHRALKDGQVLADVLGQDITVVDFATGTELFHIGA